MSRARRPVLRAVALVLLLPLLLSACGVGNDVRSYVTSTYQVDSRDGDTVIMSSPKSPDQVVADVVGRFPPLSRVPGQGVEVMRYSDDVLAVQPATGGGSVITLDDEERGTTRWIPIVGVGLGRSGAGSSGGGDFRGGGEGEGK